MLLLSGKSAALIPSQVKLACADKVSKALSKFSYTMLQFTPQQIIESINNGWTVIAFGKSFDTIGFAQL